MSKRLLIKFFVVFIVTLVFITGYLTFVFSGGFERPFNTTGLLKLVKQFSLVISVPASVIFTGIDYLLEKKIKKQVILYSIRIVLFFTIIYLVSLSMSGYLIVNSLLNDPFNT